MEFGFLALHRLEEVLLLQLSNSGCLLIVHITIKIFLSDFCQCWTHPLCIICFISRSFWLEQIPTSQPVNGWLLQGISEICGHALGWKSSCWCSSWALHRLQWSCDCATWFLCLFITCLPHTCNISVWADWCSSGRKSCSFIKEWNISIMAQTDFCVCC